MESVGLPPKGVGIEALLGSLGFSTMWKVRSQHHGQVDPFAGHDGASYCGEWQLAF